MNAHETRKDGCGWSAGSVMVELSVMIPLLLVVFLGAIDFGRLAYFAVGVNNAAHAGAQLGSATTDDPNVKTAVEEIVAANAADYGIDSSDLSVTVDQRCTCPPDDAEVSCGTERCPSGPTPRMYIDVAVSTVFTTLFRYPGVPERVTVTRRAVMRAS